MQFLALNPIKHTPQQSLSPKFSSFPHALLPLQGKLLHNTSTPFSHVHSTNDFLLTQRHTTSNSRPVNRHEPRNHNRTISPTTSNNQTPKTSPATKSQNPLTFKRSIRARSGCRYLKRSENAGPNSGGWLVDKSPVGVS